MYGLARNKKERNNEGMEKKVNGNEESIEVKTERVDDIPLLLGQMKRMKIGEIINRNIKPHGNWKGLDIGTVVMVWLCYILSEGDHWKNHVEDWAKERLEVLEACLGKEVRSLDFSDDRLGDVLEALSDGGVWSKCEQGLNEGTLRVYNLKREVIRIDTTTASSYGKEDKEGMLRFGHTKDHNKGIPQVKIATATLDPLGMPVATKVLAGNKADDPLYLPIIEEIRESIGGVKGLLYVGDSKMGSKETRGEITKAGDKYLCPLSKVQLSKEEIREYIKPVLEKEKGAKRIIEVEREDSKGKTKVIAEGLEVKAKCSYEKKEGGKVEKVEWEERRIIVRSKAKAESEEKRIIKGVIGAKEELEEMLERKQGKKVIKEREKIEEKVEKILEKHKVEGLIEVKIKEEEKERKIKGYKGKKDRIEKEKEFEVEVKIDKKALEEAKQEAGWQVLASNESEEELKLEEVVNVYRDSYLHEQGYDRLKGKTLSLTPIYLLLASQITGLIHLLMLSLRVLTVMEYEVRKGLAESKEELGGVYAGNKGRKTARPSAETLLRVFRGINLNIINVGGQVIYYLTPLTEVQEKILHLLGLSKDIYTGIIKKLMNYPLRPVPT